MSGGMSGPVLITGGAGFIGSNIAHRLMISSVPVRIFDDLSRTGSRTNLRWLRDSHGTALQVEIADVRDRYRLRQSLSGARAVIHLAAQVAVTTSMLDPVCDFETNMCGTLNLLEELRSLPEPVPLLFASTNKVYGGLAGLRLIEAERRYLPQDQDTRTNGVSERTQLEFRSPYGCSKGAADQYVLDYARCYDLPSTVFRLSCSYGQRQFGTEDQGWVAHFLTRALAGLPITVFGNGKQVRDILYVDDLVDAVELALKHARQLAGNAFNIGGGPDNAISLLELIDRVADLRGELPTVRFDAWREGDQAFYVSDIRKFEAATGWKPQVSVDDGLARLDAWLECGPGERVRARIDRPSA